MFLQVHEFEAYLFSDVSIIASHFNKNNLVNNLNQILSDANGNPELIDDSPVTAPSKHLERIFPEFKKLLMGY